MARRPLIAGNWKMNGLKAKSVALVEGLTSRMASLPEGIDVTVCPPFTLVDRMAAIASGSRLTIGAQDCHAQASGAFTGDVSAEMLADAGAVFVIVGHSERRSLHHENDRTVRAKALAACRAGLTPVLCVGETEKERDDGLTFSRVESQLEAVLQDGGLGENIVIAYEPVWAIGSGKTAELADIAAVHSAIRRRIAILLGEAAAERTRILYGGSMKPSNAREILALQDVDGGLIGGASLDLDDFWAILQTCP